MYTIIIFNNEHNANADSGSRKSAALQIGPQETSALFIDVMGMICLPL